MLKYIVNKIFYSLLVLLGVILLVFSIFVFLPSPAAQTLGQRSDINTLKSIETQLGLDKPKSTQLLLYLKDISPLDVVDDSNITSKKLSVIKIIPLKNGNYFVAKIPYLRFSYQSGKSVNSILLEALPNTIILAFFSIIIAFFLGISLGVIAAINKNNWKESTLLFLSILGVSVPSFFVAIMLSYLFGYKWSEFTSLNMIGSLVDYDVTKGELISLKNVILPSIALGLRPLAIITQLTRASVLEINTSDFVRTAKAKGLTNVIIQIKHILPNALNPVITATTGWFASLLAGAFFVEYIFAWYGIGKQTMDALGNSDFPVVIGAVLYISIIFILLTAINDIIASILDKRIQLQS